MEGPPGDHVDRLTPEERARIERAVDVRRREFATVRHFAREAMARHGLPARPVIPGDDRAPQWPVGVVGSITHTRGHCAVGIARSREFASVGLDMEEADRVHTKLEQKIALPGELDRIVGSGMERSTAAALVFSAKEAFYKAQYPLTGLWLGFLDVEVEVDLTVGSFTVSLSDTGTRHAEALRACGRDGMFRVCCGLVATGMTTPVT